MEIDHLHFYVPEMHPWQTWFTQALGFDLVGVFNSAQTMTAVVRSGPVHVVLSAPRSPDSWVSHYLQRHPPGLGDIALRVACLKTWLAHWQQLGQSLVTPVQRLDQPGGRLSWCQIAGPGDLRHTLVERQGRTSLLPELAKADLDLSQRRLSQGFRAVDHVVLNVERGDLAATVAWYERVLGFRKQQGFRIQTSYSGLISQVLEHPQGQAQIPINEPTSENSQIQEFLAYNRGPGVQHVALRTADIVATVAQLRQQGVIFLQVPETYYEALARRLWAAEVPLDWDAIAAQQILVDWDAKYPQAPLLQTFTQPIFEQPTFFFEIIERRAYPVQGQLQLVQGFGEGNFLALFEAIEREQRKRGSL